MRDAISLHKRLKGKIYVGSKISPLLPKYIRNVYTPGVAAVCKKISKYNKTKYDFTSKGNNVAIVTDGTRILGLGDVGPDAALPVMEGKSMLYREYGNINAFPICLDTKNKKKIIEIVKALEPVFGAINLEDIESPKVLDISNELDETLPIPIFHDDRHGTATIVLAALVNSLKIVGKRIGEIKVVILGAGSAGYCICQLLHYSGCRKMSVIDSKGPIFGGRTNMNKYKKEITKYTTKEKGTLENLLEGADVFIGVSGVPNILKSKMVKSMNKDPIIFALTNPNPEIDPFTAKKAGARIIATGSYQYHNKVNNALVFPYLMRAILDLKIKTIDMKVLYSTALAIANTVKKSDLEENHIVPLLGDKNLQKNITKSLMT